MKEFVDSLTGLNNMLYLFENYSRYISNKKTYLISIDFQKLKYVNDNFGHAVGDVCIMTFANLIRVYFKDSLLIRRSGDEFVVITPLEPEAIIKNFSYVESGIELAFKKQILPICFKFNCGIKKSDVDLKETLFKADITMYIAKKQGRLIEYYRDEYMLTIKDREMFIKKIDCLVANKNFTYVKQYIYDLNKKNTEVFEIYTRDDEGKKIFDKEHVDALKMNYRVKRIDLVNLETILNSSKVNSKFILNLNYQTLISHEYSFVEYLNKMVENSPINAKNICLSIDSLEYNDSLDRLIETLNELTESGFRICIQGLSFDNKVCVLPLLSNVKLTYVKINREVVEKAMNDQRLNIVLHYMVKLLVSLKIKPLFINIEREEEFEFIKSIDNRCLVKGYYMDMEEKLEI